MKQYLETTPLLDFKHPSIQQLIAERSWQHLNEKDKIQQVYTFVRDEILFGYNESDAISASQVLKEGYGQCNTKSSLLMALLRALDVPTRLHGFTINKKLQKGAIRGLWYKLSPGNILHTWVEVYAQGQWYFLEGVILDKAYLSALQAKFSDCKSTFCGYGVATNNFEKPVVDWNFNHTFIQREGINQDFGLFDNPDVFYQQHQQALGYLKSWMYKKYIRHVMNKNVAKIRRTLS